MVESVDIDNKNYPENLKEALKMLPLSLGAKKLYYKGSWSDDIFKNCLAVVGSRRLTSYGRRATEQIVTECAAAGITIVSGFMYGGDEAAHSACVRAGGRTIAVMPCGIDLVFPPTQKDLYQKILDTGGLIISEYEPGFKPVTYSFIQRDRIVAGFSKAVLVTEASLNSGSLITAKYAKQMNKKIFALPGQISSDVSKGTIKLIREGAEAVSEPNDVLSYFKVLVNPKKSGSPSSAKKSARSDLAPTASLEDKILDQLSRESMKADDLARLFAVPVAHLGTTLTMMQLKGLINLEDQKYYLN